jgi:hypothetical protein
MLVNRLVGANGYQPIVAALYNVANSAGSGSSPVTVTLSNLVDQFGNGLLPPNGAYSVSVCASQACAVSVGGKSQSGFSVTLTPLSGSIAAGTFDCLVHS